VGIGGRYGDITTIITGGTIEFRHSKPPKGAHKTYALWLDRKLEKVEPIELGEECYLQLCGAIFERIGANPYRERRSDNQLCLPIGNMVFVKRVRKS
jgi:hypothetical protein